ncbi:MAG: hypothetical protein V4561_10200 [Bacteroidota bacterium]
MKSFILDWLINCSNGFNATIENIEKAIVDYDPQLKLRINNPSYHSAKGFFQSEMRAALDDLKSTKLIEEYVSADIFTQDENGNPVTLQKIQFSATREGRSYHKYTKIKGRVGEAEIYGLSKGLYYMNSYGPVILEDIKEIVKEKQSPFNVPVLRTFLIDEGFCKPGKTHLNDNRTIVEFTKTGRKLKRAGSYLEYLRQKNEEYTTKEEKLKIETELLKYQKQISEWQIRWGNKIVWINLLIAVVAIIVSAIVSKL